MVKLPTHKIIHMCNRRSIAAKIENFENFFKIDIKNIKVMRFYYLGKKWERFAVGINFVHKDIRDPHVSDEQWEWVDPKNYRKVYFFS